MISQVQGKSMAPTAADCAEAAAWIAKLHGEDRDAQLEAGLRRWLSASDAHRAAFEMANELWADTTRLPKGEYPIHLAPERAAAGMWPKLAAAAVIAGLAVIGTLWLLRDPTIATHVGEMRNVALVDGTRVMLNTATRIKVRYDRHVRLVELEQGEAYFDVAKEKDRPFTVTASGKKITALGTAFVVRSSRDEVTVTLLDGRIDVSSDHQNAPPTSQSVPSRVILSPGQRMTLDAGKPPSIDRPVLERVTAWQRGQVILDHTSLEAAVAEMNRYSVKQLAIASERARSIEVTGVFRAGDSEEFARALAESYDFALSERSGTLVLSESVTPE